MILKLFISLVILLSFKSSFALESTEVAQHTLPAFVNLVSLDAEKNVFQRGSGFFISSNQIATNYHVIKNAKSVLALKFNTNEMLIINKVINYDIDHDLAILQIESKVESFLRLGDSSKVNIGEKVFTIGCPEGFCGSFFEGTLNAVRGTKFGSLQVSTPASAGSSGGPVINTKSEVIGIMSESYVKAQNLNFAVPVNDLKELALRIGSASQNTINLDTDVGTNSNRKIMAISNNILVADIWFFKDHPTSLKNKPTLSSTVQKHQQQTIKPGDIFGVRVNFLTSDRQVLARAELSVPSSPEHFPVPGEKYSINKENNTVTFESTITHDQHHFAPYWGFAADDPLGEYKIRVYLNDILVAEYSLIASRDTKL